MVSTLVAAAATAVQMARCSVARVAEAMKVVAGMEVVRAMAATEAAVAARAAATEEVAAMAVQMAVQMARWSVARVMGPKAGERNGVVLYTWWS